MEKMRKHAYIAAAPARIFGWLADPAHLTEIWPSVVEISNIQMKLDGAHSYDFIYKMAGVKFHGHTETVEVQRDHLRLVRNSGGIPSTFRWTFEPRDNGTDLVLEVEYEIPGQLLGRLAAPFLRRLNEREADTVITNLRERMEMGEPVR